MVFHLSNLLPYSILLLLILPSLVRVGCRSSVAAFSATVLALVAGYVLLALGGGLLDEGELTVGEAGGEHGVNVEDYLGATACRGHVVDVGLGLAREINKNIESQFRVVKDPGDNPLHILGRLFILK